MGYLKYFFREGASPSLKVIFYSYKWIRFNPKFIETVEEIENCNILLYERLGSVKSCVSQKAIHCYVDI